MKKQLSLLDLEGVDYTPTPDDNAPHLTREQVFGDYNGFVEKFKGKRTTDDCYTPDDVYDVVAAYVRSHLQGEGTADIPFVRPFYPGGDYERYDYPPDCVVVDNPPFSIYSKIVRWYLAHNIRFFLFAPTLTAIVQGADVTYLVTSAATTYANGAVVNTSFVTSLEAWRDYRIVCDGDLKRAIEACDSQHQRREVSVYSYDAHLISIALMNKFSSLSFAIGRDECRIVSDFDGMRERGKSVFGSGIILNDGWAAEFSDDGGIAVQRRAVILPSDRERDIIQQLINDYGKQR